MKVWTGLKWLSREGVDWTEVTLTWRCGLDWSDSHMKVSTGLKWLSREGVYWTEVTHMKVWTGLKRLSHESVDWTEVTLTWRCGLDWSDPHEGVEGIHLVYFLIQRRTFRNPVMKFVWHQTRYNLPRWVTISLSRSTVQYRVACWRKTNCGSPATKRTARSLQLCTRRFNRSRWTLTRIAPIWIRISDSYKKSGRCIKLHWGA